MVKLKNDWKFLGWAIMKLQDLGSKWQNNPA